MSLVWKNSSQSNGYSSLLFVHKIVSRIVRGSLGITESLIGTRCDYPNVRKSTFLIAILFMTIGITIVFSNNATAQQPAIPVWVKNTAKWWGEGQISDDDFIKALQWLISQGIIVIPNNQQTSQTAVSSQSIQQTQTVSKSLTDMLPTRDDIGTEWLINNYTIVNDNATDYKNKITQNFKKYSAGTVTVLDVNIYNYDSPTGAQQHYDSKTSALKSHGGYTEISGLDAGCYGTTEDLAVAERDTIYCVKNNFYLVVGAVGAFQDTQDSVTTFAKVVFGKMG